MSERIENQGSQGLAGVAKMRLTRRHLLGNGAKAGAMVAGGGALASFLAACGSNSATGTRTKASLATIKPGGVLTIGIKEEPDSLDPAKSALYAASEVYNEVFDKLVEIDQNEKILPQLATKWTEQDATTWVFELRQGVKFHNGDQFTAEDVQFTFERILDPKTASPWAVAFDSIEKVEPVSPHRVVFHLKTPFAPFLVSLANNSQIVNKRAIESGNPARNPVGTGPFKFKSWSHGSNTELVKNAGYWEDPIPYLEALKFNFTAIDASSVQAVRSGELNFLESVPPQSIASVESDPSLTYVTSNAGGLPEFLCFGVKHGAASNKLIRQAVAWGIDRKAINEVAFFGAGEPGSEEMPKGSPWYDGKDPYLKGPDIAKAKELVEQSGLPTPVKIEYLAWSGNEYPVRVGQLMKQQLEPAGIDIEVKPIEFSVWLGRVLKADYEMTVANNERTIDPDNIYSTLLVSDAEENIFGFENPQFDAVIAKAREETAFPKRKKLYEEARQILFDEVPLIFLQYETPGYLMQNDVLGAEVRPNLELGLAHVGYSKS
jgi:peptide/nickel transport system substrate-binding protein